MLNCIYHLEDLERLYHLFVRQSSWLSCAHTQIHMFACLFVRICLHTTCSRQVMGNEEDELPWARQVRFTRTTTLHSWRWSMWRLKLRWSMTSCRIHRSQACMHTTSLSWGCGPEGDSLMMSANLNDANASNCTLSWNNNWIHKVNINDANASNYILCSSNNQMHKAILNDTNASNYVSSSSNNWIHKANLKDANAIYFTLSSSDALIHKTNLND